jgi:hypothetical protein
MKFIISMKIMNLSFTNKYDTRWVTNTIGLKDDERFFENAK